MTDDVRLLVDGAKASLPPDWPAYPGGWPGEIEAALLDAVLSIRARYGGPDTGVRGAISRWRTHRSVQQIDDLDHLAHSDPHDLARVLDNHQLLPGGNSKAKAVAEAAAALIEVGVRHSGDLHPDSVRAQRAYESVRGLGPVTWSYFTMLLGTDDIKADTWIVRFVQECIGRPCGTAEARTLMREAAQLQGVDARSFDHAVWSYMRTRDDAAP